MINVYLQSPQSPLTNPLPFSVQIAEHTMVDSCVRMLLRWQGSYDGSRVDAVSARLPEAVADMLLLPDTADWNPEAVLPTLQVRRTLRRNGERAGGYDFVKTSLYKRGKRI